MQLSGLRAARWATRTTDFPLQPLYPGGGHTELGGNIWPRRRREWGLGSTCAGSASTAGRRRWFGGSAATTSRRREWESLRARSASTTERPW